MRSPTRQALYPAIGLNQPFRMDLTRLHGIDDNTDNPVWPIGHEAGIDIIPENHHVYSGIDRQHDRLLYGVTLNNGIHIHIVSDYHSVKT